MAQEDLAARIDRHLLPDRRAARGDHPPRRPGYARGGVDHLLRDLLHDQHHGREAGQGGVVGRRLRHVALVVHPHAHRRLPHLEGDQRLVAARHRLVRRADQGPGRAHRAAGRAPR